MRMLIAVHDQGSPQSVRVLCSDVGVVPVRSRLGRLELVSEALAGRDRALRDMSRAVHEGVALLGHPMPVDASILIIQVVRDVDDDLVPNVDLQAWAGPLAVDA